MSTGLHPTFVDIYPNCNRGGSRTADHIQNGSGHRPCHHRRGGLIWIRLSLIMCKQTMRRFCGGCQSFKRTCIRVNQIFHLPEIFIIMKKISYPKVCNHIKDNYILSYLNHLCTLAYWKKSL